MKDEEWYVILNMNCKYEICRMCPKSGLFKGSYEECEKWIEQKMKEEMTDEEMADKHAEEYVMREDVITENDKVPFDNGYGFQTVSFEDEVKKGYKDGFLAGLKAGRPQWHYVKDCLPQKRKLDVGAKSETVYVATRGYGIYIGYYNFSRKVWYLADNDYQEIPEVYAWCELPIPPKEIK